MTEQEVSTEWFWLIQSADMRWPGFDEHSTQIMVPVQGVSRLGDRPKRGLRMAGRTNKILSEYTTRINYNLERLIIKITSFIRHSLFVRASRRMESFGPGVLLLNFFTCILEQNPIFAGFFLGCFVHPIEVEVLHVVLVELVVLGQLLVERNLGVFDLEQERDSEPE